MPSPKHYLQLIMDKVMSLISSLLDVALAQDMPKQHHYIVKITNDQNGNLLKNYPLTTESVEALIYHFKTTKIYNP